MLQLLLLWLVGLWIVTAIEPFNRRDWLLENLLVFVYGDLLIATYRRFQFANLSYGLFGLLITFPFRELPMRAAGVRRCWSYLLVIVTLLGFGGFYEALEGVVAVFVSPELGAAYLGTQGDERDAQKDTTLAFSGSVIAMAVCWWADRHGQCSD